MLRYFVAGNGWLLFAALSVVGSGDAGSSGPDSYRSFFGAGKVPTVLYVLVVMGALGLAAWYFLLYLQGRAGRGAPGTAPSPAPR